MTNKQFESQQEKFGRILHTVIAAGRFSDEKHAIEASKDHVIWVTDLRANRKVAYSSTKADFDSSLDEFIADYFM